MLGESSPRMSEWLCLTEPLYWPVSPASLETLIPCWPLVAAPPEVGVHRNIHPSFCSRPAVQGTLAVL